MTTDTQENKTIFYDYHVAAGGKMVPFAGYLMPVQYSGGIMQEHLHSRDNAGLFDVSHMGQVIVKGEGAAQAVDFGTTDTVEAMTAFIEKREPRFTGR